MGEELRKALDPDAGKSGGEVRLPEACLKGWNAEGSLGSIDADQQQILREIFLSGSE